MTVITDLSLLRRLHRSLLKTQQMCYARFSIRQVTELINSHPRSKILAGQLIFIYYLHLSNNEI